MAGLLRFIFFFLIFYYLYKILVKYILPYFVKKTVQNFQKKYYQQHPNVKKKKDGEVSIEYDPSSKEKIGDIGEYVDFEEIDSNNKRNNEKHRP